MTSLRPRRRYAWRSDRLVVEDGLASQRYADLRYRSIPWGCLLADDADYRSARARFGAAHVPLPEWCACGADLLR